MRVHVLIAALVLSACGRDSSTPIAPPHRSGARSIVEAVRPVDETREDALTREILALERDVPGLGGVFWDDSGRLTIKRVGGRISPSEWSTVAAFARSRKHPADPLKIDVPRVSLSQLEFSRLVSYRQSVSDHLASMLAGIGIADRSGRVLVTTRAGVSAVQLLTAAASIGVDSAALLVSEASSSSLTLDQSTGLLTDQIRPLVAGLQFREATGNPPGCTLGALARKFSVGDTLYAISALHCARGTPLSVPPSDTAWAWLQPGAAGPTVGHDVARPIVFTSAMTWGDCAVDATRPYCIRAEAVLVALNRLPATDVRMGYVAMAGISSLSFSTADLITGTSSLLAGTEVDLAGSVSGRQPLVIELPRYDHVSLAWGGQYWVRHSFATRSRAVRGTADVANPGDSGAPDFVRQGFFPGSPGLVGIHNAELSGLPVNCYRCKIFLRNQDL